MWMLIVGGILLLLALLAVLPLGVRLVYEDSICLYVYLWKIRIRLLPHKRKNESVRAHTPRARARKERREQRRAARKEKRQARKNKRQGQTTQKKPSAPRKKRTLAETATFVRELGVLALELLLRFVRYAKLEIARLIVIIGTGDAAETAKLYGIAQVSVSHVVAVLDEFVATKSVEEEILVRADFLADTSTVCCDIRLQMRVWQLLTIGVKGLFGFLRVKAAPSKKKTSK